MLATIISGEKGIRKYQDDNIFQIKTKDLSKNLQNHKQRSWSIKSYIIRLIMHNLNFIVKMKRKVCPWLLQMNSTPSI